MWYDIFVDKKFSLATNVCSPKLSADHQLMTSACSNVGVVQIAAAPVPRCPVVSPSLQLFPVILGFEASTTQGDQDWRLAFFLKHFCSFSHKTCTRVRHFYVRTQLDGNSWTFSIDITNLMQLLSEIKLFFFNKRLGIMI